MVIQPGRGNHGFRFRHVVGHGQGRLFASRLMTQVEQQTHSGLRPEPYLKRRVSLKVQPQPARIRFFGFLYGVGASGCWMSTHLSKFSDRAASASNRSKGLKNHQFCGHIYSYYIPQRDLNMPREFPKIVQTINTILAFISPTCCFLAPRVSGLCQAAIPGGLLRP